MFSGDLSSGAIECPEHMLDIVANHADTISHSCWQRRSVFETSASGSSLEVCGLASLRAKKVCRRRNRINYTPTRSSHQNDRLYQSNRMPLQRPKFTGTFDVASVANSIHATRRRWAVRRSTVQRTFRGGSSFPWRATVNLANSLKIVSHPPSTMRETNAGCSRLLLGKLTDT